MHIAFSKCSMHTGPYKLKQQQTQKHAVLLFVPFYLVVGKSFINHWCIITTFWKNHKLNHITYTCSGSNTEIMIGCSLSAVLFTLPILIRNPEYIFPGNNFIPFNELLALLGLYINKFLEYLQLKSISQVRFTNRQLDLELSTTITQFLQLSPPKLLSKMNSVLLRIDGTVSPPTDKWEKALSISPDSNGRIHIYYLQHDPKGKLTIYRT